jgi:vacuolar iron transporter family protein
MSSGNTLTLQDEKEDYGTLLNHSDSASSLNHLGSSRQYWRDIILGVNDGIISTFLLVTGVSGGGLSSKDILMTAIAGGIAGSVSMFAGEYVATKSQNEVMHGEIALEQNHIKHQCDSEIAELGNLLELIGISEADETPLDLCEQLKVYYRSNPKALLKVMVALEFGVLEDERRRPLLAGLMSCCLFAIGSLPSVIPFIFSGDEPLMGLAVACIFSLSSLLLVGVVKSWATRGDWVSAAVENFVIAGFGGILAYATGAAFDAMMGGA